MDILTAVFLLAVFIALPLYLRSNMLLVLGALAFGWVLNDITGNEVMLISRSLAPGIGDAERYALLLFSFLPAIGAVFLTKNGYKKPLMRLLAIGLAPSIFIIGWLVAKASFSFRTSQQLSESVINEQVIANQEYALWAGVFIVLLLLLVTKPAKKSDDKKGKK